MQTKIMNLPSLMSLCILLHKQAQKLFRILTMLVALSISAQFSHNQGPSFKTYALFDKQI